MSEHCRVCPWWAGFLLDSPLRRWRTPPRKLFGPYVQQGMTVLDVGPGMGSFTRDLARMAGPEGRVVAVDIQPKMLETLARRALRKGFTVLRGDLGHDTEIPPKQVVRGKAPAHGHIQTRLASEHSLGIDDLEGYVGFVLAFMVVHEVPDPAGLYAQLYRVLRPGGTLFLAEPANEVPEESFRATLEQAREAGFQLASRPKTKDGPAAVLRRPEQA